MIAKRPIYLTILPSLVIIIGYIWYRRKRNSRVDCDTGGDTELEKKSCSLVNEGSLADNNQIGNKSDLASALASSLSSNSLFIKTNQIQQQQQQQSLPIGTPQQKKNKKITSAGDFIKRSTPEKEEEASLSQQNQSPSSAASSSSSSSSLCKSAPIDIVAPNLRSPPKRITEQELDREILKLKPEESEFKNLRYIEKPDSDLDTPLSVDSPPYRSRFDMNRTQSPSDVVKIVKGTVEAKISPDNTFRERKYTHTESDDIENNNKVREVDEVPQKQNVDSANNSNEDEEIKEANEAPMNNNNINSSTSNRTQPQIASPSLSVCSMHSGDSGQGSSPPQSVGAPSITYEFLVPIQCVGFIIGNRGNSIARIKERTGATVIIRKSSHGVKRHKICSIEGTQSEIDAALKMIKQVVPDKKSYNMSMERIFLTPDNKIVPRLDISSLQLKLIEGINNDVSVCAVISGGHIFLQQPLHPTYPSLAILQHRMNRWYSIGNAPELPNIIDTAVCAYYVEDNWYRVQIVSHNDETKICVIKYLDFGGYENVNASDLRQIHADFMRLPFQAIECVLGNIRSPNGSEWSRDSVETILSFTNGVILQAQVSGYTQDGIPEVLLFVSISKDNVLFINQELCARKLAEWVEQDV